MNLARSQFGLKADLPVGFPYRFNSRYNSHTFICKNLTIYFKSITYQMEIDIQSAINLSVAFKKCFQ